MADFSISNSMQIQNNLSSSKSGGVVGGIGETVGQQESGEDRLYPYKLENGVTLELSFEAREKLIAMNNTIHNMEVAKDQGEAMKKAIEDMGKIMLIFRRIANGDIVPPQDEQKLMEYSSQMYQMAKTAALSARNDEPKEYDSVDEEKGGEAPKEGNSASGGKAGMVNSSFTNGTFSGVDLSVAEG